MYNTNAPTSNQQSESHVDAAAIIHSRSRHFHYETGNDQVGPKTYKRKLKTRRGEEHKELYCTRFSIADLLLGAELRMMDEMYGLHSTAGYTAAQPPSPEYEAFESSSVPIFGSEHMLSANSAVSDTASMQRSVGGLEEESNTEAKRAKIASHPLYPKLLSAYIDCQKVGAPPEIADLLDEICRGNDPGKRNAISSFLVDDPDLDEFMETYCEVLVKYKSDLESPFDEATTFLNNIEAQFNNLCTGASRSYVSALRRPIRVYSFMVGAPPEIADLLDEICRGNDPRKRNAISSFLVDDPDLDEFMNFVFISLQHDAQVSFRLGAS
ncbi:unnamed protein product [Ilex paraguariensis]|uniref:Uncharacterized protein n=1 Tax=Ilex paraguariensis TaxID=185542 RepID=A0ABC8R968_9AQUA